LYLTLYIPQYSSDLKKLEVISLVLVVIWLIVICCWIVTTLGSEWRIHENLAYLAMYGGSVTLAVISALLFIFLDNLFWLVAPSL